MVEYAHVIEGIPKFKREIAERALAYARADLELPGLRIKWFVDKSKTTECLETFESDHALAGKTDPRRPKVIWLNTELEASQLRATTFHETYHCFQYLVKEFEHVELSELHSYFESGAKAYAEKSMLGYTPDTELYVKHLCDITYLLEPISKFDNDDIDYLLEPDADVAPIIQIKHREPQSLLDIIIEGLPEDQAEAWQRVFLNEEKVLRQAKAAGVRSYKEFTRWVQQHGLRINRRKLEELLAK